MKKIIAIILVIVLALAVAMPAIAGSIGLGVGSPPSSPSSPWKNEPEYSPDRFYYLRVYEGEDLWIGNYEYIKFSVRLYGDSPADIKVDLVIPESLASGYAQLPYEFCTVEPALIEDAIPEERHVIKMTVDLPDEQEYYDKKWQGKIEFSAKKEVLEGSNPVVCVVGDNFYTFTPEPPEGKFVVSDTEKQQPRDKWSKFRDSIRRFWNNRR